MFLRKKNNGFTLVELLVAVFILAFGITGIMQLFTKSMISSNLAWDLTMATSHADCVLERMQDMSTLRHIETFAWDEWILQQELHMLPDEQVEITFLNPGNDPLNVDLNLSWRRHHRDFHMHFHTRFTK